MSERDGWRPIETAPKDGTHLLLFTSDFGPVEGWWDRSWQNFYKSQKGWASYAPEDAVGDWVSHHSSGDPDDHRMYCGMTPTHWQPLPKPPEASGT